jgi:hypothetical protein
MDNYENGNIIFQLNNFKEIVLIIVEDIQFILHQLYYHRV